MNFPLPFAFMTQIEKPWAQLPVDAVNAIRRPSGDHAGWPASSVSRRGAPLPEASITEIAGLIALPVATNAIFLPSGDQAGSVALRTMRRTWVPSVFQTSKAPSRSLVYAIHLPSGDQVGCVFVATAARDRSAAEHVGPVAFDDAGDAETRPRATVAAVTNTWPARPLVTPARYPGRA
jgi:hypothetical protein